jgi:acyl carrier protein
MQTIDRKGIENRVLNILDSRFGDIARTLDGNADLSTALPGFDSLAALELVTAVETEFSIEVDFVADDVRFSFSALNRITDYVQDSLEDLAL